MRLFPFRPRASPWTSTGPELPLPRRSHHSGSSAAPLTPVKYRIDCETLLLTFGALQPRVTSEIYLHTIPHSSAIQLATPSPRSTTAASSAFTETVRVKSTLLDLQIRSAPSFKVVISHVVTAEDLVLFRCLVAFHTLLFVCLLDSSSALWTERIIFIFINKAWNCETSRLRYTSVCHLRVWEPHLRDHGIKCVVPIAPIIFLLIFWIFWPPNVTIGSQKSLLLIRRITKMWLQASKI